MQEIKEQEIDRRLVGFVLNEERAIPRTGYKILSEDSREIGFVTSGSQSITLNQAIGLGYVKLPFAEENAKIHIKIRNREAEAAVTMPPFIKR
ncbi:MAG: glycine cleavage T C-terminal barrel domain-containing protein [Balneolaceae bacterium]|nr:glycine cleavage T C-terminal barrel domain-containing protein [Balneolaceae bacterium]